MGSAGINDPIRPVKHPRNAGIKTDGVGTTNSINKSQRRIGRHHKQSCTALWDHTDHVHIRISARHSRRLHRLLKRATISTSKCPRLVRILDALCCCGPRIDIRCQYIRKRITKGLSPLATPVPTRKPLYRPHGLNLLKLLLGPEQSNRRRD